MKPVPIPGYLWVASGLLVRTRKATKLALPQCLYRTLRDAGVACVVNLMSKAEHLQAEDDVHHGPSHVFMCYAFWPEPGMLPIARQVRQAIDWIEDAHALGLRVLLNGAGHRGRAAVVAGCWRAREGYEAGDRLDWLEGASKTDDSPAPTCGLSTAEREFVAAWPTGRAGQPELADMAWSERDEVFPFASVEYWLRRTANRARLRWRTWPGAPGGCAGTGRAARERRREYRPRPGRTAPGHLDRRAHPAPAEWLAGGLRLSSPMTTQTKGYPRAETIGIVSASHEAGRQLSDSENSQRDEALRRDLTGCRWHQVRGRFGCVDKPLLSMVNPFVAVNMTKEAVGALGAKCHQFHVIFGCREGTGEDLAWRFELLEADSAARVVAVRRLFANERKRRLYLEAGCPDDEGVSFLIPVEHEQLHR